MAIELVDQRAHALARARVARLAVDERDEVGERHRAVEQHEDGHGLGRDGERLLGHARRVDQDDERAAGIRSLLQLDGAQARVRWRGGLAGRRSGAVCTAVGIESAPERPPVGADEPARLAAARKDDARRRARFVVEAHAPGIPARARSITRTPSSTASGSADSSGLKRPEWCANVLLLSAFAEPTE